MITTTTYGLMSSAMVPDGLKFCLELENGGEKKLNTILLTERDVHVIYSKHKKQLEALKCQCTSVNVHFAIYILWQQRHLAFLDVSTTAPGLSHKGPTSHWIESTTQQFMRQEDAFFFIGAFSYYQFDPSNNRKAANTNWLFSVFFWL